MRPPGFWGSNSGQPIGESFADLIWVLFLDKVPSLAEVNRLDIGEVLFDPFGALFELSLATQESDHISCTDSFPSRVSERAINSLKANAAACGAPPGK